MRHGNRMSVFRLYALAACTGIAADASAQCQPSWAEGLGGGYVLSNNVNAMTVYDDGTGPALYAAGIFESIGGVAAQSVAKWDGRNWRPVGTPLVNGVNSFGNWTSGRVFCMTTYDPDGPGPRRELLIVGGDFRHINALATFDDTGLVSFTDATNVAAWDGSTWSPLYDTDGVSEGARGTDGVAPVLGLAVGDIGDGPELYVCGSIHIAGAVDLDLDGAPEIARWNGATNRWRSVGHFDFEHPGRGNAWITSVHGFDDGSGYAIYVATSNRGMRRWRLTGGGTRQWELISPMTAPAAFGKFVEFDPDGPGPTPERLFYMGVNLAEWDGAQWLTIPTGTPYYYQAGTVFDDGSGEAMYLGFQAQGGSDFKLMRYKNRVIEVVGNPVEAVTDGVVCRDMVVWNDGAGDAVYVAGAFRGAASDHWQNFGRWDGHAFGALTDDDGGLINSIAENVNFPSTQPSGIAWDIDGSGPAPTKLCVVGAFDEAADQPLNGAATWDGAVWSPLGNFLPGKLGNPFPNYVSRLLNVGKPLIFNDGSGDALYVSVFAEGGASDSISFGVYRFRPSTGAWQPVGNPLGFLSSSIRELRVLDYGSGPQLIALGRFTSVDGTPANGAARWTGSAWQAFSTDYVQEVEAFNDGTGLALYGAVRNNEFAPTSWLAKWNGTSWVRLAEVASPASGAGSSIADMLAATDNGSPALFLTGTFETIGGVLCNSVAMWDGSQAHALGNSSGLESIGFFSLYPGTGTQAVLHNDSVYFAASCDFIGGSAGRGIARYDTTSQSLLPAAEPSINVPWQLFPKLDVQNTAIGPRLFAYNIPNGMSRIGLTEPMYMLNPESLDWEPVGSNGLGTTVSGNLASFDDGQGMSLYVIGCTGSDGAMSAGIARWGVGAPRITDQPDSLSLSPGETNVLICKAHGPGPLTFQWKRNGVNIPGADTRRLILRSVTSANAGNYTCQVSNACGNVLSTVAVVTVGSPCLADFNNSGTVTVQDIFDFLAAWFAGEPAADINSSASVTVQDIFDFLSAWFAGC